MPDTPTPLDLDATTTLAAECDLADRDMRKWVRYPVKHLRSLLAEMERLRAEVQERDEWLHEAAALLPEGFDGDEWEGEVIARFIRQAARPAPAWDEDAIRAARDEYVRHNLGMAVGTYGDRLRCAFEAGVDAVRERVPVKPDREGAPKRAYRDRQTPIQEEDAWAFGEGVRAGIDAVLDLWPGRSEATVKAEALNEAADSLERLDGENLLRGLIARIRARADRLAAEGGAS